MLKNSLMLVFVLLFTWSLPAGATRVEFVAPRYHPTLVPWPELSGFVLAPNWDWNGDVDNRNAPYIPGSGAAITSTFGTFTFNAIEIGGWPWDNFDIGRPSPYVVPLIFLGANGELLGIRSIEPLADNTFGTFAEDIEGVRSIFIQGGSIRLGAITFNEPSVGGSPIPEPGSLALTVAALLAIWVSGWLAKRRAVNPFLSLPTKAVVSIP